MLYVGVSRFGAPCGSRLYRNGGLSAANTLFAIGPLSAEMVVLHAGASAAEVIVANGSLLSSGNVPVLHAALVLIVNASAALKLELIGQAPPSSAPPGGYVEALFDSYARTFETSLVQKLVYRVPELVLAAIEARGVRRFRRAIDLGCGTGLMGAALRPFVDRLDGCDISSSMLRKAEAKAIYDRLEKADLQTLSIDPMSVDLVVAADVFLYVGALERIMATVAAGLAPDGLFAFSVEKHEGPRDMALRPSRRYAHSQAYLRRVVAAAGMEVASMQTAVIRMDRGEPIEGLIVVAAFPSP